MSNYPDNVTGNELELAGPDWEGEAEVVCEDQDCDFEGEVEAWSYGGYLNWECPKCELGHSQNIAAMDWDG